MFSDHIYDYLETALDANISEHDFWQMTLAEYRRAVQSSNRRRKDALKEKATLDYIQADLIGRSIARLYSSSAKMPSLPEAYPSLFEENKEKQHEQKMRLAALRFKQFAQAHNEHFREEKDK